MRYPSVSQSSTAPQKTNLPNTNNCATLAHKNIRSRTYHLPERSRGTSKKHNLKSYVNLPVPPSAPQLILFCATFSTTPASGGARFWGHPLLGTPASGDPRFWGRPLLGAPAFDEFRQT